MYLSFISGYELGQFLRIILWIFLPVAIISMLVTTWLHYRRRRRDSEDVLLSIEGFGGGEQSPFGPDEGPAFPMPLRVMGKPAGKVGSSAEDDEAYNETVYKSILWMKEKYEQYRDMSDLRYERLKEELVRSEKKYDDLLASIVEVKVGDRREKLLSGVAHAQVEERAVREVEESAARDVEGSAVRAADGSAARGNSDEGVNEGGEKADPARAGSTRVDPEPRVDRQEGNGEKAPARERAVRPEMRPVLGSGISAAEIERDSLRDLLAERNQQIIFLQRQLDQRIKDFHLAEHEGRGARGQIQELEEQAARTRQRLEEEADRIRHQLDDEIARGRRQLEEQVAESKRQMEEQDANAERKLEEKQRAIVDLEEQIHILRQKIEELVDKLRNNSQLLLNIYQELDKSLKTTDAGPSM